MQFYYYANNATQGPLNIDDLIKVIDLDTLVWNADGSTKDWKPAKEIKEIADRVTYKVVPPNFYNDASLYIYRPWKLVGAAMSFKLSINDIEICTVKNKFGTVIKLQKEDRIYIKASGTMVNSASTSIDIKYGEHYFLKCELNMGLILGNISLHLVDPHIGQNEYDKI